MKKRITKNQLRKIIKEAMYSLPNIQMPIDQTDPNIVTMDTGRYVNQKIQTDKNLLKHVDRVTQRAKEWLRKHIGHGRYPYRRAPQGRLPRDIDQMKGLQSSLENLHGRNNINGSSVFKLIFMASIAHEREHINTLQPEGHLRFIKNIDKNINDFENRLEWLLQNRNSMPTFLRMLREIPELEMIIRKGLLNKLYTLV